MRAFFALLATTSLTLVSAAIAGDEHRELGAHEHGHGTLNIAIEADTVKMELIAPGDDIAGFEHEAKSKKDKEAAEKAKASLKEPLKLFKIADGAQCSVKSSEAKLEQEKHGDEKAAKDHDHGEKSEAGHSEFRAEYTLTCKAVDKLTSIDFGYFSTFKNAQELNVTLISPKGQSTFEATRDKPVITFDAVM